MIILGFTFFLFNSLEGVIGVEIRFNNSFLSLLKFLVFVIFFSFFFSSFIFSKPIVDRQIFASTEVLLWMTVTGAVSPIVRAQQYACDLFENNKR